MLKNGEYLKKRKWKLLFALLILLLILILGANVYFSAVRYLSRPADLSAAKKAGDDLLALTNKKIFVVVAHPDDAEAYAGGSLNVLAKKGNEIIVVVATSGEKGGNGNNLALIREKEQLKAAKILGYSKVIFLRFPDRDLKASKSLINKINQLVTKHRPSFILTFDPINEGYVYRHPDHKASGKATLAAINKQAGLNVYLFHSSKNNVIANVSDVYDIKMNAFSAHQSQQNNRFSKYRRIFTLLGLPRRGPTNSFETIGVRYAEVFRKLQKP